MSGNRYKACCPKYEAVVMNPLNFIISSTTSTLRLREGRSWGFTRTSSSLFWVRALMLFTRFRRNKIHQKMHVSTSPRDEIVDKIAVKSANCLLSNAIFPHISNSSTLFKQSFHPGMKLL